MDNIVKALKSDLRQKLASQRPKTVQVAEQALRIVDLETRLLKNLILKQGLQRDALLLSQLMTEAERRYGRVMMKDLEGLGTSAQIQRAIAIGFSQGLITIYNDKGGQPQYQEVRIVDYDYPEGHELTTGSEDWHYFRRRRIIDEDTNLLPLS